MNVDQIDCSHIGNPSGCVHIIDLIQFLQNASNKAVIQIDNTLQHIYRLVPDYDRRQADRADVCQDRGLFDFVGQLSHSLFGTARDSDVAKVEQMISHLKAREHQFVSAWEQAEGRLASFGKAVNHRVDAMERMIATQKKALRSLYDSVAQETSAVSRASSLIAHAFNRFEDFVILLDKLNSFQHGLELLTHGFLSPALVSPSDIDRVLTAVTSKLREGQTGLRVLRNKVMAYYKMHDFMASRQGNKILLHLSIPLGILPTPLYLFEVDILPLSIHGSPQHATILTNIPKFIAYHPLSPYFLEFEKKPPVSPTKLLFQEHMHVGLQLVSHPSCLLAILTDKVPHVPSLCQFVMVTNFVHPRIYALDRHHVFLINVSDITIRCANKPDHNISCGATCRVALPCGCELRSRSMYLPGRVEGCFTGSEPTVLHSVNLAVLQKFFKASELSGLFGNTLLPDPVRIFVPPLKIFEANFSHELEMDKRARFALSHIVNLTKNDKKAFSSLAHAMVDDWQSYSSRDFEYSFSFFSWKTWGLVIIGVMSVVSFGLVLNLSYKVRILATTITTVSLATRVHAIPRELTYISSTMNPFNQTNIFQFQVPVDLTLDITVILLLVVIVVLAVIKGFRHHRKTSYQFDLFLQVGVENLSCEIYLKTFKLDPSFYRFSATTFVESLEVIGFIWPRLFINWSTLKIHLEVTNETYTLSKTVSVTWRQAAKLRRILRKSFWTVLVTSDSNGYRLVPLSQRDVQDIGNAPAYDNARATHHVKFGALKPNASAPALYPVLDI